MFTIVNFILNISTGLAKMSHQAFLFYTLDKFSFNIFLLLPHIAGLLPSSLEVTVTLEMVAAHSGEL